MPTLADAVQIAETAVAARSIESGIPMVLVREPLERPLGWVFAFESQRYLNSGGWAHKLLGNGPLYVAKGNGAVRFLGTYAPFLRVIEDHEATLTSFSR